MILKALRDGLSKTRENLLDRVEELVRGSRKLDDAFFGQLEEILIQGDLGPQTSMEVIEVIRRKAREKKLSQPEEVIGVLREELLDRIGRDPVPLRILADALTVILVVGVNGVGKTTSIGKIAYNLKTDGKRVMIAAGDTFRAAAIEQLETWAERVGADLIKQREGSDPAAIAYDALQAARARKTDVLIIDTAGRLHTKVNLMEEIRKMKRVLEREYPGAPHEVLLVIDATTGQNAIEQARLFNQATGVTGIVLTKLDGSARGGIVIPIREKLDLPVKLIGIGEDLADLRPFDPREYLDSLFHREKGDP